MMKTGFRIMAALLLAAALWTAAIADSARVSTGGGKLNMRKNPEDKAKILTTIKNGESVEVTETEGIWAKISYKGQIGYVKREFLKEISGALGKEIYSNGDTLYLRESPDPESPIVGLANAQAELKLEQADHGWALISTKNARGYVPVSQIDQLNDVPAREATQKLEEGILQKETKIYREPDTGSEVIASWPKGTGVYVSVYNKKWSLIQVQESSVFGFVMTSAVSMAPLPAVTDKIDPEKFSVTASGARKTAEKALKQYPGFRASSYICRQETMYQCDGIKGPLYRFVYTNKKGQMIYAAYVHCETGQLLYKADYSGFKYDRDISDLKTAPPPAPTPEPIPAYDEEGNLLTEINLAEPAPMAEHAEGTPMDESKARNIADRYLSAKYPRFSELSYSRVSTRYVDEQDAYSRTPYYQFDYWIEVEGMEVPQYSIAIHAVYGDIEGCSGPGEGNG